MHIQSTHPYTGTSIYRALSVLENAHSSKILSASEYEKEIPVCKHTELCTVEGPTFANTRISIPQLQHEISLSWVVSSYVSHTHMGSQHQSWQSILYVFKTAVAFFKAKERDNQRYSCKKQKEGICI